jgi:NADH:ubiquinone oxidoreductase subunit K
MTRFGPMEESLKEVEMTSSDAEKSQIMYARLAGFMFLFVIVAGLSGMFIANRFAVPENFAEIAHRIMGSELLYRIGLSSGLISSLGTVFLAMGLYIAVKPIDNNLALLALLFRLVEATLGGVLSILSFSDLKLYIGADCANAFTANQLSVLVHFHSGAFNIGALFFSIGSILFFYLFIKSTYIPKFLSALGLFASVLMSIVCFASLISPQHAKMLQLGWLPMFVAEVSVGLWLLFKGVNVRPRGN